MGKYLDMIRQLERTQPIETVRAEEALKQQKALDSIHTIQPGSLVTWHRGDGSSPLAFVDFLHLDPDGKEWAFLSYGKTWAVVDRRLLSVVTP